MPPDDGDAVEPLINRINFQVQERVCVRADQPPACIGGFLAIAREQQSGARLADARLYACIRRILPAALQGDFYARGIVLRKAPRGEKTLLPESSGLYVKRKNQISAHPLKWLELVRISDETKRHKCANYHAAASFDEAPSICEHYSVSSTAARTSSGPRTLWGVITADRTHTSRKRHAECISVFRWSLRRHAHVETIGALLELQFCIAAQQADGLY